MEDSVKSTGATFESLGKQAENLTLNEQNGQPSIATNGALPILGDGDDQKIVDEIESLCMNCHENVLYFFPQSSSYFLTNSRALLVYYLLEYPSFARS
jgi:hypothetical protein